MYVKVIFKIKKWNYEIIFKWKSIKTKKISSFLIIFKVKKSIVHLGRWNVENCNKRINIKIDLANEDHCGPCGKYIKKIH
jgi:hypothetical protein